MAIRGQCLICEEMFTSNNLSALPCGHIFHADCIQTWFGHTATPTCPNCRAFIATNQIVRRLFFNACDDQNVDELMVNLRETKVALSRAEAEIQELKNNKKEVEDKLALEVGKVASFGVQIENQNRQLDEATNLQKKLIGELSGEREELKILRKMESDSVLRIQNLEEQLRISKKNENDSKLLIKNMEEQLRILEKNEHLIDSIGRNGKVEKLVDRTIIGPLPTKAQRATQGKTHSMSAALPPPPPSQLSQQCENQTLSPQSPPKNCIFCGEPHRPTDCMVYSTLMARMERIANLNRCERCLGPATHMATSCRTKSTCFFLQESKKAIRND